jgi:RNA polymerase sigma-70 factor, ECF subfamily
VSGMTAIAVLESGRAADLVDGPGASATAPAQTATADAMNALWRLHGGALLRFALKLTLGDRQRAEDVVQETMIRAWRHPEVVDGREQVIRGWLFTVTRHVVIDLWRARSRSHEVIEDEPTDRPDPVDDIDQTVTALDVRAAIAQLTPKHRQVVVEMFYYGRQVDEIAESLGIPAGTVKSRAYYALRQLKRVMSAPDGDPADFLAPQDPGGCQRLPALYSRPSTPSCYRPTRPSRR